MHIRGAVGIREHRGGGKNRQRAARGLEVLGCAPSVGSGMEYYSIPSYGIAVCVCVYIYIYIYIRGM
jgi:hypothetical protein